MNREGSERKNPLVYFLGSANASLDTSNQQNQMNTDILVSDQLDENRQSGDRLAHQLFREEPIVGDTQTSPFNFHAIGNGVGQHQKNESPARQNKSTSGNQETSFGSIGVTRLNAIRPQNSALNRNGRIANGMNRPDNSTSNNNDLDSSNVLYDEDFEIEEDKNNYFNNNQ